MIKFEGKDLENKIELVSFLDDSFNISKKLFNDFVSSFDIDPSLFEHIYNADLIINNEEKEYIDEGIAFYLPSIEDPSINVHPIYLKSLLNENDYRNKYNLAMTLLHEMIHINRTILINNIVQCSNYVDTVDRDLDISEFDRLLFDRCNEGRYEEYDDFVLLKRVNSAIWIYNKLNKHFEIFMDIDDLDNIVFNKPVYSVPYIYYLNTPRVASDYCLDYTYSSFKNKDKEIIVDISLLQIPLEECLTETLSRIITYKTMCNLDIESTIEYVRLKSRQELISITTEIFKNKDFIKWFLLSCYEDEYYDYLKDIFKENYTDVLKLYEVLFYETSKYYKIISRDKFIELNKLVRKKIMD